MAGNREYEDVLREFLIRCREEVTKVTQLDYTYDRRIELEREETRKRPGKSHLDN